MTYFIQASSTGSTDGVDASRHHWHEEGVFTSQPEKQNMLFASFSTFLEHSHQRILLYDGGLFIYSKGYTEQFLEKFFVVG
jgi:hypothetical protein